MCGIFGSPTITPSVRAMLPYIGIAMQSRGRDAWGGSDGQEVIRHVGELTSTWDEAAPAIDNWSQGIFHTRAGSCGARDKVTNAHPFEYLRKDGDRIIGIHNGIITNHLELDRKYSRNCEVDSMHIWMHRAEGKPWSDLEGWGNLAWWETNPHTGVRVLNLCRFNNEALKVVQLKGGEYLFASEELPLRTIAKMLRNPVVTSWHIDEFHPYWFEPDPKRGGLMTLWRSEKRLPFPDRTVTTYQGGGYSCGFVNRGRRGAVRAPISIKDLDAKCLKCGNVRINSKDNLLCMMCFNEFVGDYIKVRDSRVVGVHTNVN